MFLHSPGVVEKQPRGVPGSRVATIFLWNPWIPDPDGDSLHWKLQNSIPTIEGNRQGDAQVCGRLRIRVVGPHSLWRKEHHGHGVVTPIQNTAAVVFPLHTK